MGVKLLSDKEERINSNKNLLEQDIKRIHEGEQSAVFYLSLLALFGSTQLGFMTELRRMTRNQGLSSAEISF